MKAVVVEHYGGPEALQLREVLKPVPKADECLVRVHAASINDWDWEILRGAALNRMMSGLFRPRVRILGCDVAGRVEAVGADVRSFRPGDEVFGDLSMSGFGAFAEYAAAPERALGRKPPAMSFTDAAAIPQAGMLAVQGLIDVGGVKAGQKILLNGAGGGVGTFALQLAKLHDVEVTAVDSAGKLDMLRRLGADHVIDYAREDFAKGAGRYDLILDVKTNRSPFAYARALNEGGVYATVGGSIPRLMQMVLFAPLIVRIARKRLRVVVLKPNKDLGLLGDLYEQGKLRPIIDGPYKLTDIVQAFRHFGAAAHKGKVVVTIGS
jgi:NADPH:quinone reductase-like Zn-dependent oxidoreductase